MWECSWTPSGDEGDQLPLGLMGEGLSVGIPFLELPRLLGVSGPKVLGWESRAVVAALVVAVPLLEDEHGQLLLVRLFLGFVAVELRAFEIGAGLPAVGIGSVVLVLAHARVAPVPLDLGEPFAGSAALAHGQFLIESTRICSNRTQGVGAATPLELGPRSACTSVLPPLPLGTDDHAGLVLGLP